MRAIVLTAVVNRAVITAVPAAEDRIADAPMIALDLDIGAVALTAAVVMLKAGDAAAGVDETITIGVGIDAMIPEVGD